MCCTLLLHKFACCFVHLPIWTWKCFDKGHFPFNQKFQNEISGIPCDERNCYSIFQLVGLSHPRPSDSKFGAKIRSKQRGNIPLHFPDEFKGHFRMTRQTCELFTCAVMPTGRIPPGNGSGQAAILPSKQVLAFLWSMANQEPAQAVADRFDKKLLPCWVQFPGSEKLGPKRNGQMERNFLAIPIFWNFRPTLRGTSKISEWNSGKRLIHSLPHLEFLEFLVEWNSFCQTFNPSLI